MEGSTVPKNTKNSQDSIGKELVLVFGLTRVYFLFLWLNLSLVQFLFPVLH